MANPPSKPPIPPAPAASPMSIPLTPGMQHSISVDPVDNGGVVVRHSQYSTGPEMPGKKSPKPSVTYHASAPSITIGSANPTKAPMIPKSAMPKMSAKAAAKPAAKPMPAKPKPGTAMPAPDGKKPWVGGKPWKGGAKK